MKFRVLCTTKKAKKAIRAQILVVATTAFNLHHFAKMSPQILKALGLIGLMINNYISTQNVNHRISFFNKSITLPNLLPIHATVVASSNECINFILSTSFAKSMLPVTILKITQPVNQSIVTLVPFQRRNKQIATHSYRQLKSPIFVFGFNNEDSLSNFIPYIRNSVFWNSRAYTFLIDCSNTAEISKASAKIALEEAYNNYEMYNVAFLKAKSAVIYNPFSSSLENKFNAVLHSKSELKWSLLFPKKFQNLNGHQLKVCTFSHPPMVVESTNGHWGGVEIEILRAIASEMNFTHKIMKPANGTRWGFKVSPTSWNGLYGNVMHNRVDLGFANLFIYAELVDKFDWTNLYDEDFACWAVPNPIGLDQDWLGIVKVFSRPVWILTGSELFVFLICSEAIQRRGNVFRRNPGNWLLVLGSFLGVSLHRLPRRMVIRTIWGLWMLFGLILSSTYRGGLISKLALPTQRRPIDTADELYKSKFPMLGYVGFKWMLEVPLSPLLQRFEEFENIQVGLERVAKSKHTALLESRKWILYMREKLYSDDYGNRLIHVAKACPGQFNIGFIFPIDSKYFFTFNRMMSYVLESGLSHKWYDDVLHEARKDNSTDNSSVNFIDEDDSISSADENIILSMTHLRSAFMILTFGLILSASVFLFELYRDWRKNKLAFAHHYLT